MSPARAPWQQPTTGSAYHMRAFAAPDRPLASTITGLRRQPTGHRPHRSPWVSSAFASWPLCIAPYGAPARDKPTHVYLQKAIASSPAAGPATRSMDAEVMSMPADTPDEVKILLPSSCTQRECGIQSTSMSVWFLVQSLSVNLGSFGIV